MQELSTVESAIETQVQQSVQCTTKQSTEFSWKKPFGLVGSDEFKGIKRLQNIDNWYSNDDYDTIYNREYDDIQIKRDLEYELKVEINDGKPETNT